jgi:hypothetical protein
MKIVQACAIAALLAGSTAASAQDLSTRHAREFRASVPAGAYQQLNNNFVNPDADYHYPSDGLHPRPAQTAR